jgi:hypothetical protein
MSRLLWRNCFDLLENIETTNRMTLWMRRRRKPRGLSCRQHILMRLQKLAERCWDFERGNEAFVFRVRHQPGRGRKSGFKYIEVLERVKTIHWHWPEVFGQKEQQRKARWNAIRPWRKKLRFYQKLESEDPKTSSGRRLAHRRNGWVRCRRSSTIVHNADFVKAPGLARRTGMWHWRRSLQVEPTKRLSRESWTEVSWRTAKTQNSTPQINRLGEREVVFGEKKSIRRWKMQRGQLTSRHLYFVSDWSDLTFCCNACKPGWGQILSGCAWIGTVGIFWCQKFEPCCLTNDEIS